MQNEFKLIKNKKAINDVSIIAIITAIFLGTAIIIPFVNSEFGVNADVFNESTFASGVQQDAENVSGLSAFTILLTVLKLAFFDFSNTLGLPFWLEIFFTLLAIIFTVVIARNIWVGGGG